MAVYYKMQEILLKNTLHSYILTKRDRSLLHKIFTSRIFRLALKITFELRERTLSM